MGRTNNKPILDTHEYCVEFDDGEFSELMENVIIESMYVVCDDDRNKYLMIDSIVDYSKNNKAVTIANQKVLHRGQNPMRWSTVGWQLCLQ